MSKVGEVVSRNISQSTVRVKFPLYDDKVSSDLIVITQGNSWMPNVGDQVLCIFIGRSEGFVVGVV